MRENMGEDAPFRFGTWGRRRHRRGRRWRRCYGCRRWSRCRFRCRNRTWGWRRRGFRWGSIDLFQLFISFSDSQIKLRDCCLLFRDCIVQRFELQKIPVFRFQSGNCPGEFLKLFLLCRDLAGQTRNLARETDHGIVAQRSLVLLIQVVCGQLPEKTCKPVRISLGQMKLPVDNLILFPQTVRAFI